MTYNAPDGAEVIGLSKDSTRVTRALETAVIERSERAKGSRGVYTDKALAAEYLNLGDQADNPTYKGFRVDTRTEVTGKSTDDFRASYLGADIDVDRVGLFYYRHRVKNFGTGDWNADTLSQLEAEWLASQGTVGVQFQADTALTSVFGDDLIEGEHVYPGWKPGDRVRFVDGQTIITEVISGYVLEFGAEKPTTVRPTLGRKRDTQGVFEELVDEVREAKQLGGRAALA